MKIIKVTKNNATKSKTKITVDENKLLQLIVGIYTLLKIAGLIP